MLYLNIFTSYKWSMPLFTRPFGVRIFISRTIKHVLGTHLIATGNLKLMNYFYKLNHEHAICFPWVNIILITESKSAFKHNKLVRLMQLIRYSNASSHMHYALLQTNFSIVNSISDSTFVSRFTFRIYNSNLFFNVKCTLQFSTTYKNEIVIIRK